jgi:AsmA protein
LKPLRKKLVIACLVLLGLLVGAALAIPFLVDEETIRGRVEESLSTMLERQVELGELSLGVGWRLRARAARLHIGPALVPGGDPAAELHAEDVRFRLALLPLLQGKVDIRSLALDDGAVTQESQTLLSGMSLRGRLTRESDGVVQFDGRLTGRADFLAGAGLDAEFETSLAGDRLEIVRLDATLGPGLIHATGAWTGLVEGSLAAVLDLTAEYGATVANGRVEIDLPAEETVIRFDVESDFVDFDELARMAGVFESETKAAEAVGLRHSRGIFPVAMAADPPTADAPAAPLRAEGTLSAGRGLFSGLEMTSIGTEVTLNNGDLRFRQTRFDLYGGSHKGTVTADTENEELPFVLNNQIENVDLNALVTAFSPESAGSILGTAALFLDLAGRGGDPTPEGTVQGTARIEITDGSLTGASLVAGISRALKAVGIAAPDGEITPFERLSAGFRLSDRIAVTDNLELRSPHLDLDGSGSFGLDGTLDFQLEARLSKEITSALTAKVGNLGSLVRNDRLQLPIELTGKLEDPKVGVDLNNLLKEEVKEKLRNKLKGFFNKKR